MTPSTIERPCGGCPWRQDGPPTWRRHAASAADRGDIYDCREADTVCVGWLATVGRNHPAVVAAVADGEQVLPETTGWPALFESLDALQATLPPLPEVDPLIAALVRRRREQGLTQQDIADATGLTVHAVAKIEQGVTPIRLPELHAYAARVGWEVRLDWAPD